MKKRLLFLLLVCTYCTCCLAQNVATTETKEIYFRIIELETIGKDSIHAYLNAGSKDGISKGLMGSVRGAYIKGQNRYDVELGFASVIALNDTLSLLLLRPNEKSSTNKELSIQEGDLVSLKIKVPLLSYRSVFFELGCLSVFFNDVYGKPLYKFSELINNDSKLLENDILKKSAQDVISIYNYYKDEKDTSFNVFKTPLKTGRYQGKSIFEVMRDAQEKDIYAFLNFVNTYPKAYIGNTWKIGETFATWVLNGAYYSKAEMKDSVLLYAKNVAKLKTFLNTHKNTFSEEDFVHKWLMDAFEEPDSSFEKTIFAAKTTLTYLPNDNDWGTYHYAMADRLIDKEAYKKALLHSDSALNYYTKSKNSNGIAVILFLFPRCYYNLSDYKNCISTLIKANNYNNDAKNNVRESTKKSYQSYFYRLTALSYYFLQDYKLAVENFVQYINLAKTNGSFNDVKSAISMQDYLTKIYVKQGETVKALEIYIEQLALYSKLNDQPNVAATYDKIAGANYKLGNYRLAINDYTKAKTIHIALKDINSAGYSQSNIGLSYWNLGKYDSSVAAHEQAIQYRKQINSNAGLGYSWKQLGELYKKTGEKEKSFAAYDSATQYYTLAKDTASISSLLSSYGDVYYNDKQYQKAFAIYSKWNTINQASNNKSELANSLYWLGTSAYYFNDDTSKKYSLACLQLAKEIGDKSNEYYANANLGLLAYKAFNYDEGNVFYNNALSIAIYQANKDQEAYLYRTIGSSYNTRLDFDKAIPLFKKSLHIYDSLGNKTQLPLVYRSIGSSLQSKGDFYEARKYYDTSIRIATQINNRAEIGYGYSALTFLHIIQGELSKAQEDVDSTYAIFKQLNNAYQMAEAYFNMALVFEAKSDGENAIKYYKIADSIYLVEKDLYSRSTCHTNMGAVLFYQSDFKNSLKYFLEADRFLSTINFVTEAHILAPINIGEAQFYLKDYTKAEENLTKGYKLAIQKKAGRMINIAASFLGKLFYETKKYTESEKYLLESLAISEKSNETDLYLNTSITLAKLYTAQNKLEKGNEYFNKAYQFIKKIDNSKYTWWALYEYGLFYYNQNKYDSAIKYFKDAVAIVENESQNLFGGKEAKELYNADARKVDLYNKLVVSLAKSGNKEDALFYADKSNNQAVKEQTEKAGLVTNDKAKEEAIKKGGELLQKQNAVDQAIAKEKTKPEAEQNKQLIASLESIQKVAQKDYINYINGLVKKYPDMQAYFSKTNPADFKNSMRFIPDSTLAVLYIINDNQLFIFTATKEEIGIKTIELKQDINKQAEQLLGILKNPLNVTGTGAIRLRSTIKSKDGIKGDFKTEASILYDMLITPIKDQIKDKKNICIIPNGKLSNIPFQSLGTNDAQGKFHFLVEDYAIFYTNKMDIFSKPHEVSNINKSFIALGNPDKSLPNASEEVKNFSGIVKNAAIYTESEATETKATEGLSNYQYVHFATHGILDYADFEKSYLVFAAEKNVSSDGKLTIEKINGLTISNCSLVTLSACETAVSKEAVKGWYISPANSFLQNNVSSVVASLWQVDDKATSVLMTEFYKNLSTMSKVEALRKAQETLSKNPDYSHPYFWSAFVLYGEWR